MVTRADQQFAELVFKQKLCPKDQISACLKEAHEQQQEGNAVTLAQVMVRKRLLTPGQVQDIQRIQQGRASGVDGGGDVLSRPPGPPVSAPPPAPAGQKCPVCEEPMTPGAEECSVCGASPSTMKPGGLELTVMDNERECPRCKKLISHMAPFCSGCGADFCPKCRTDNDRGYTKCRQCGDTVDRESSVRRRKVKKASQQVAVLAVAVAGAVINLVVAISLFLF